jgi:competence protein ComEA
MIVVDVAGKVAHPGVYTLPAGSRAIDALKVAGNALSGVSLTDINLAHVLVDGEQIIVGVPPVVIQNSARQGIAKSSTAIISVNSASLTQLQVLRGIGPTTAKRIVDYRKAHGSFATLEDFRKASKLGTAKFAAIKKQLRL